jgi:hypothetical protein
LPQGKLNFAIKVAARAFDYGVFGIAKVGVFITISARIVLFLPSSPFQTIGLHQYGQPL